MITLALVSQKGGAGKSTLASNIAALAASGGLRTAIIDLDAQASISAWHAAREADDITLVPSHPPLVSKQVEDLDKQGYQFAIIDTPPHNSTAAANAITAADYTLIPVRPSSFDLVAAQATFDLLEQNGGQGGVLINAVPAGTKVETPATSFVKSAGLTVLARIGQRVAFQHAINQGQGVTEYEPNGKAAEEVINLWNKIQGKLS